MAEPENHAAIVMPRSRVERVKRGVVFACGIITLSLGIIGIAMPILPTTPFLLLASACFLRSSERANNWLLGNKLLGSYIRNYKEKRGMTKNAKACTLSFLWGLIIATIMFMIDLLAVEIILLVIASLVTMHILHLKTV